MWQSSIASPLACLSRVTSHDISLNTVSKASDSAIQRMNHSPVDEALLLYPLGRDSIIDLLNNLTGPSQADVRGYCHARSLGRFNFLSKDQLTKKKDRILIKDLISNK